MTRGEWKMLSLRLMRLLSSSADNPEGTTVGALRILAFVSPGSNRASLVKLMTGSGWDFSISDAVPGAVSVDPKAQLIILYDRELSPPRWRETVASLTKRSPKPYVILLSASADANLWDELQRLGGAEVLRTPATKDNLDRALVRASRLLSNQRRVRSLPRPWSPVARVGN